MKSRVYSMIIVTLSMSSMLYAKQDPDINTISPSIQEYIKTARENESTGNLVGKYAAVEQALSVLENYYKQTQDEISTNALLAMMADQLNLPHPESYTVYNFGILKSFNQHNKDKAVAQQPAATRMVQHCSHHGKKCRMIDCNDPKNACYKECGGQGCYGKGRGRKRQYYH